MSVDKTIDPSVTERRDQRYGEDPNLEKRAEDDRKDKQKEPKEYFHNTIERATKIAHGMGPSDDGKVHVQTYQPSHPDFEEGKAHARKLIMVYFLYQWYGKTPVIEGNKKKVFNTMRVADNYWKYLLTEDHWVEVWHA